MAESRVICLCLSGTSETSEKLSMFKVEFFVIAGTQLRWGIIHNENN